MDEYWSAQLVNDLISMSFTLPDLRSLDDSLGESIEIDFQHVKYFSMPLFTIYNYDHC